MTDQDLALLEQLTYVNKDLYEAAGINHKVIQPEAGKDVASLLRYFDD